MNRVRFLDAARNEFRRAYLHYAEENPHAAARFAGEALRITRLVREAPLRWPAIAHGARRLTFVGFPFSRVYRFKPDEGLVEIVAVAHQHRRPDLWSRC